MKHGTYTEAVQAGFTPDQAGFLARFGIDTKDEVLALLEERAYRNERQANEERAEKHASWAANFMLITIGCMIGSVIGAYL